MTRHQVIAPVQGGPVSGTDPAQLRWQFSDYEIEEFNEFTFSVASPALVSSFDPSAPAEVHDGQILVHGETIDIQFRVRSVDDGVARCGFFDLPLQTRERIINSRRQLESRNHDELQSLSYDQLAKGTGVTATTRRPSESPARIGLGKKLLAVVLLTAGMVLIAGWTTFVLHSRSTVALSNSVMVGNYHPVNTPLEGRLLSVDVNVGDEVHAGQVLATVGNDLLDQELAVVRANLIRAKQEFKAYQRQVTEIETTFSFASQKLDKDRSIAEAEMMRIDAQLTAAEAALRRMQPLAGRGNISKSEHDQAVAQFDVMKAEKKRQEAVLESLDLFKAAAGKHVLINETMIENPMSEVQTNMEIALATITELEATEASLAAKAEPTQLLAPESGTIYAIYRHRGEFLKTADEAIAMSLEGDGWASGHVATELATSLCPGQRVEVEIPSLNKTTTGVIDGIGHRSVYGRGGYNADFRSGPQDVPIRVTLDAIDEEIPAGMRLNMTVRIHDHLRDFRNWAGRMWRKLNAGRLSALWDHVNQFTICDWSSSRSHAQRPVRAAIDRPNGQIVTAQTASPRQPPVLMATPSIAPKIIAPATGNGHQDAGLIADR